MTGHSRNRPSAPRSLSYLFVFYAFLNIAAFVFAPFVRADAPLEAVSNGGVSDAAVPGGDDGVVTGAGAHFAWIIFDAIKSDLERRTGRRITLYGKNSMLGQGCNAGVKTAKLNGAGGETFGFVCCPLDKKELEKEGLILHPIALEPILILVNKDNPVNDLTAEQVRAIFRGDIVNWREVGGHDSPIVVVTRLHCRKRPGHWKTLLPERKRFREVRLNVSSAAEMVQRVSDFPGAIGHTGATWLFETGNRVKAITVDGAAPTAANLQSKRYPFYRKLSAITDLHPSPDVMKIIREVQTGPAFRHVARRFGLLPLNPARVDD